jgi:hypothetical protein
MIIVTTNLPALIVTVWNGHLQQVAEKHGAYNAVIPYSCSGSDASEKTCEIKIEDLPKGLYRVRLCLPYYSAGGQLFEMPVAMDIYVTLRNPEEPQIIKFLAGVEIVKPQ